MRTIKCSTDGCNESYKTSEHISPKATYSCKNHTEPNEDRIRFQSHQFDKDLRIAKKPIGTSHIRNQGSDVMTADEIGIPYGWEVSENYVRSVCNICDKRVKECSCPGFTACRSCGYHECVC